VSAVEEGRRIYDNILKAIQFLLSSNVGEIILLFLAILIAPVLANYFGIDIRLIEPLLPIHILWVNLVTDSLPALALAVDPAEKDVMNRKPNKKQKGIFTKGMTWRIAYQGVMIGLLTLAAFIIGLGTKNVPVIDGKTTDEVRVMIAQTMAFIVLALSELVHVFNIRNNRKSIFTSGLFSNVILIGAIALSAGLMFVVLLIPGLRELFGIVMLPTENIIETICLVFAPVVIVEIFKLLRINTIKGE
jgi:Ca2+-transporting ATPase